jgi:hypothetical protein
LILFWASENDHKRLDKEHERNKRGDSSEVEMMSVRKVSDMCFVRVCPVFHPLNTQVLFLRYYIKKHVLVPLYRLLMCMYSTKSTHIIIIISTKVQYSIVSVLIQYKSVI